MIKGIVIFSIPLPESLVLKFRILLTSLSRSLIICISRPAKRPFLVYDYVKFFFCNISLKTNFSISIIDLAVLYSESTNTF